MKRLDELNTEAAIRIFWVIMTATLIICLISLGSTVTDFLKTIL